MDGDKINNTHTQKDGLAKITSLFASSGGEPASNAPEEESRSLKHAPVIPSSEEIARMTVPAEAGEGGFLSEDVVFHDIHKTSVRDPHFASHILEQEKRAPAGQNNNRGESALPSFEIVGAEENNEKTKRIRTYQSDVAEALKSQRTSIIQMVLSEQEKKRDAAEEVSPKQPKNMALMLISATLIATGVGAAGFAAWRYAAQQKEVGQTERALSIPSIIFAETKKGIDITGLSKDRVARAVSSEIASVDLRLDFIEQIYFAKDVAGSSEALAPEEKVQILVSASELFNTLESGMPESLARALAPDFFFGIHVFNGNQPFIILRTDFFESAFAGMLKWESSLARDVLPLFGKTVTSDLVVRPFEDVVIRNRDLRILRNKDGIIVLIYLFQDKHTIIIATADETIKEVVDRLNRPEGAGK